MILNNVDWQEFVAQYTAGVALTVLCKHWHVDSRTAKRKLGKLGVPLRTRSETRKLALMQTRLKRPPLGAEIIEAYKGGMPIRDLAKLAHVHARDLKLRLKQAGVEYRGRGAARSLVMAKIPAADVGARYGKMREGWRRWYSENRKPAGKGGL